MSVSSAPTSPGPRCSGIKRSLSHVGDSPGRQTKLARLPRVETPLLFPGNDWDVLPGGGIDEEHREDVLARVSLPTTPPDGIDGSSTSHSKTVSPEPQSDPSSWWSYPAINGIGQAGDEEEDSLALAQRRLVSPHDETFSPSDNNTDDAWPSDEARQANVSASISSSHTLALQLTPSPTIACQWDQIMASFNRALTAGSHDEHMTGAVLQEIVAGYRRPVGSRPEFNLSLRIVTPDVEIGVACSCHKSQPHYICDTDTTGGPTLILARAMFQLGDGALHGSYTEQLLTSVSGNIVPLGSADQILNLGHIHWRTNWHTSLRVLARRQLCDHVEEACRSHNKLMAYWLAARLLQTSEDGGAYTCFDCYDDYFVTEDEVTRQVCEML